MVKPLLSHHSRRSPPELPDLDQLVFTSRPRAARSASVHASLRQAAVENRNDHFQPFYSIRAVANHFHIPIATVSRIYQRLSAERLLRLVWGSKTLLEPTEAAKKKQARTVGIPIDLIRFTNSSDYRHSILNLQREIWKHRINEHLLFFEKSAEEILHICKRDHANGFDTLIWLLPDPSHRETLFRLHDRGICVICLGDRHISGLNDFYTISPRCTAGKILRKAILKI